MKHAVLAIALTLAGPAAAAPGDEHWIAASTTALSITGDVRLEAARIVFRGGASLPIARVRNLSFADETGQDVPASLYRVTRPDDPALIRGNKLCGGPNGPVTFLVIWHARPIVAGQPEGRAFGAYTGPNEPPPTIKGACATYRYALGQ